MKREKLVKVFYALGIGSEVLEFIVVAVWLVAFFIRPDLNLILLLIIYTKLIGKKSLERIKKDAEKEADQWQSEK